MAELTARIGSGEDLVIVDGRYIADPWILETEGLSDRAVFDLENPMDHSEVRRLYGDRQCWHLVELPVELSATR